jgi:2-dehydro-3-deoxyphosphogluconate aldolase/(4S)-4-hydroxy-2-oxoglutarate aldolase
MVDVTEKVHQAGIVPVIVLEHVQEARPLADALQAGDLSVLEITLRSEAGLPSIEMLAGDPTLCVGAGTVLNRQEARRAIDAGAQFIVSPGFDEATVSYCLDRGVVVLPGVCTATEVQRAHNAGLDAVKFFPAEAFGGILTVKALAAPFKRMKFVPTGGIDRSTLSDYLAVDSVLAVGGSWMVARKWIEAQDYQQITNETRQAREMVQSIRGNAIP